uniref:Uncharacterized protein n=1 Tax=Arundo donax TaxID=35708 RepID=A0A0A9BQI0_ARUDO
MAKPVEQGSIRPSTMLVWSDAQTRERRSGHYSPHCSMRCRRLKNLERRK